MIAFLTTSDYRLPATDYRPSEGEGLLAWRARMGEVRGCEDLDRRWPWCERCGEPADGLWSGRKLCAKCLCDAEVAELSGQFVRAIGRMPLEGTWEDRHPYLHLVATLGCLALTLAAVFWGLPTLLTWLTAGGGA